MVKSDKIIAIVYIALIILAVFMVYKIFDKIQNPPDPKFCQYSTDAELRLLDGRNFSCQGYDNGISLSECIVPWNGNRDNWNETLYRELRDKEWEIGFECIGEINNCNRCTIWQEKLN